MVQLDFKYLAHPCCPHFSVCCLIESGVVGYELVCVCGFM